MPEARKNDAQQEHYPLEVIQNILQKASMLHDQSHNIGLYICNFGAQTKCPRIT
jgi:hypothetical protein